VQETQETQARRQWRSRREKEGRHLPVRRAQAAGRQWCRRAGSGRPAVQWCASAGTQQAVPVHGRRRSSPRCGSRQQPSVTCSVHPEERTCRDPEEADETSAANPCRKREAGVLAVWSQCGRGASQNAER